MLTGQQARMLCNMLGSLLLLLLYRLCNMLGSLLLLLLLERLY
jgi:hypothetical protein